MSIYHYSSKYYDPVKAHEYYMRNRKLKPRRSIAGMTDEGKKKWAYVQDQIKTERRAKMAQERTSVSVAAERLREQASQTRERIAARLKSALAQISSKIDPSARENLRAQAAAEREKLTSDLKSVIGNAREKLKSDLVKIKANYESILDKEHASIASSHKRKRKTRKKSTTKTDNKVETKKDTKTTAKK